MERSSFLPVVLYATGGCGKGATALLKRIAHLHAGVTEQGALLSADGSATVPAWFCAPAGQCDVPAGCSACVVRPGRGMCLPGRRRGPGGCLNLTLVVHNNYFKV